MIKKIILNQKKKFPCNTVIMVSIDDVNKKKRQGYQLYYDKVPMLGPKLSKTHVRIIKVTKKQYACLAAWLQGHKISEIAQKSKRAQSTIKSHLQALLKKSPTKTLEQLAKQLHHGLLEIKIK